MFHREDVAFRASRERGRPQRLTRFMKPTREEPFQGQAQAESRASPTNTRRCRNAAAAQATVPVRLGPENHAVPAKRPRPASPTTAAPVSALTLHCRKRHVGLGFKSCPGLSLTVGPRALAICLPAPVSTPIG